MIYVKIDEILYPAIINGRISDDNWDGRASQSITLEMSYETAKATFIDGLIWSIVQKDEIQPLGTDAKPEIREAEFDNSEYNLAGDITDHRDGRVTVKMGKLTDLEEAYELLLGGAE